MRRDVPSRVADDTLHDRTVVIVDDGLATGATMRAALRSVRDFRPARIVTAVPVASRSSAEEVRQEVDELVAVVTPARFDTVSSAYDDYSPVTDDDVLSLLGRPNRRTSPIVRDISGKFKSALTRTDENANPLERTIGCRPSTRRSSRTSDYREPIRRAHDAVTRMAFAGSCSSPMAAAAVATATAIVTWPGA